VIDTRPGDDYAVETTGVSKRFGDRDVVKAVDLRVPRGTAFGYLGPNGAGKTTLIRMLLGLTPASAGSMQILGMPVPERRRDALARVGAIVEEPRFHDHLTGRENLQIVAAARGRDALSRIDDSLAQVGLAERARDRVKTYSLGMRQRLGLARCLLADPEILILDEPMNGLDPSGILEFRTFVDDFVGQGRTIVLSSHLLDEVEKTCDHVAIVDRGAIVAQGSLDDLRHGSAQRVRIRVDDPATAQAILRDHRGVASVETDGREVVVTLAEGASAGELNRLLVSQGVDVGAFELVETTLEERFLSVTSRLGDAA
jgi:ABC-2 type transport system ATP-binding protein